MQPTKKGTYHVASIFSNFCEIRHFAFDFESFVYFWLKLSKPARRKVYGLLERGRVKTENIYKYLRSLKTEFSQKLVNKATYGFGGIALMLSNDLTRVEV